MAKTPEPKRRPERADGRKSLLVYINPEVIKELKKIALDEDRPTYEIAEEAHCSSAHLKRYLAEFDFRYNQRIALGIGDEERTTRALRGIVGKRLTYRDSAAAHG